MIRKPLTKEDFFWTSWTPDEIREKTEEALSKKKTAYEVIKKILPTERTFGNTIAALDRSNDGINPSLHFIRILLDASPKEEIRESAKQALDFFQKEIVDIEYDEGLYRAVKEYESLGIKVEGPDEKLLHDTLREYRRMGFELSAETRDRLKTNHKRLGELSIAFQKTINDWEDSITLTETELEGLAQSYINSLQKTDAGAYKVTLAYPDYLPFMDNSENALKRKELAEKFLQKGGNENMERLREIVGIRRENAELLGYKDHAEYKTEVRMAKTGIAVRNFLFDLADKLTSASRRDIQQLTDLKREMTGESSAILEFSDIRYYINQHKKRSCDIDTEKVKEYFPLEKVTLGTFEIYSKLLSVQFEKLEGYPLWHEDVEFYKVSDLNGELISYFSLDLFPRKGKFGHACVVTLIEGWQKNNEYVTPCATMLANFPKPSAHSPSLMPHDQVETFFHEFGHIMQGILTKASYMSQSGNSVAWDFVEVPSQMLENWVWDKEMLKKLSSHYEDQMPMPEEMSDNLIKTAKHMSGYIWMRQLMLGLFDLKIHTEDVSDYTGVFNDLHKKYLDVPMPEGNLFPAGFGHLMGYDAGYYGYLWSKVYADDMFTRFKKEGLLNPATGGDYRRWILEKGSTMDELELVKGFLGREPNNKAFLDDIGVS